MRQAAPLLAPYRALGVVTDGNALSAQRRGAATFITTSAGRAWQLYNAAKLTLVFVGPQLPKRITALASKGELTFAACGGAVHVCKRAHVQGVYQHVEGDGRATVRLLEVLGELVLSAADDGSVCVWQQGEYHHPKRRWSCGARFTPTAMCHPPTYLNKVLLASEQGALQLWNLGSGTLVHTFAGWGCAVRCVAPTSALDVVAVGLADGRALLHNLRYDKLVASFNHDAAGGAVTSVAVRAGAGVPLLAVGGVSGTVTLWHLERRALHAMVKDAHEAAVTWLQWSETEPVLMSASTDNSVKQWLMEEPGAAVRLLRYRCGHSLPPTCVLHYDTDGRQILSAGQDLALRVFSTVQDQQSVELSQRHVEHRAKKQKVSARSLKLPRVTAMASCTIRERDWANVVTAHHAHPSAYVWSLQSKALGKHVLTPPSLDHSHSAATVTAVAISPCGNTALVATEAGTIDAFNLQSGLHRGDYVRRRSTAGATQTPMGARAVGPAPPAMSTKALLASMQRNEAAAAAGAGAAQPAHDSGVVSVAVDTCNRWMVSCGMDGFVRVWAYKHRTLQQQWSAGCALRHAALHAASGLLATSGDDLVIGVYDVEAGRRVRRLKGHTDRLTAVHWAADARWLLSASMDGTTRVWDIPAAQCLQVMHLGAPVTALSMSPAMDLLATTHVGRVGLYLWANRPLYLGTAAAAAAAAGMGGGGEGGEAAAVVDIRMPSVSDAVTRREEGMEEGAGGEVEVDDEHHTAVHEVEEVVAQLEGDGGEEVDERGALPVAAGAVTLSKLPKSQWQSLMHLETIKQRNKPILPPTKPQAAPFFLPTVGSVSGETVFDVAAAADEAGGGHHGSKLLRGDRSAAAVLSEFVRRLQQDDFSQLTEHVRGLGPAALDVELQAMALMAPDAASLSDAERRTLGLLLQWVRHETAGRRNFELVQSVLHRFLQLHGHLLGADHELRAAVVQVEREVGSAWGGVSDLLQDVRCMYGFFAGHG